MMSLSGRATVATGRLQSFGSSALHFVVVCTVIEVFVCFAHHQRFRGLCVAGSENRERWSISTASRKLK
jgi:hypothetical protein